MIDNPALLSASRSRGSVLALYVLDDSLIGPAGDARTSFLHGCLRALAAQLDGKLLVVRGDPVRVVPEVAAAVGAGSVHIAADAGPYGRRRDAEVERALDDVELLRAGSPYAVTPGRVRKPDGDAYRVFTPFYRAWLRHGWPAPADTSSSTVDWLEPPAVEGRTDVPDTPAPEGMLLPEPGEEPALDRWRDFLTDGLAAYAEDRDRPDRLATTRLSPYLRWGCLHPRTLLADLAGEEGPGPDTLRSELAWREFHADVLWQCPDAARGNYDRRFDAMVTESGAAARMAFDQWCEGRTGYPIVDAGMRQLLAEGWMHNRIRMVVASFLVKDLHLPWRWGARHFMRHLVDGDLASNQLNWQWVAGSGTDAAPYFRIFNPVTQGEKFDPAGDYVRAYIPELRAIAGKAVHQPWKRPPEQWRDYPAPVVEHGHERRVALERYGRITGR